MYELEIVYFDAEKKESEVIDGERLQTLWKESSGFFWIDINNPDINVLSEMLASLDITCDWTDHFQSPEILPHIHDAPSVASFYIYDIENVESLGDTSRDIHELAHLPLLVILGRRFIITYHQQTLDLVNYIKKDYEENFKLAGQTQGFIAFLLFQHCLYNYARLNLMNDNFLDEFELGLISGDFTENIPKISTAGFNILALKKLNANLHIILLMLVSKENHTVSQAARVYFNQIIKESVSTHNMIDSSRYLLDSVIASIDAESSRKSSEIIRVLTITSCIFMPLSLITGIFGMNFHNLPGLEAYYGFHASIAAMLTIVCGFLIFLRHLGWIGRRQNKPKRRRRSKTHHP